MLSLMRQLAAYVQGQANGSKAVILSSGLHTTKVPVPYGPLSAPVNLRLTQTGMSGQLLLRMNRVRGVSAGYNVHLSEAATGSFTDYATTSKTKVLFHGLTPATTYWVRARANGAAGPSGWSTPTTAMAI